MNEIIVKLVRSRIGTSPHQRKCLDALGLRKMQTSRTFKDTPAIRGIIRKVPHMLEVTQVSTSEEKDNATA